MEILVPEEWKDYALLDSGFGRRLERFGDFVISRPDPQAIWKQALLEEDWKKADASFRERWEGKNLPEKWKISYGDLTFFARLTPFKHTGIFPEQAVNWDWMRSCVRKTKKAKKEVRILNLFGYTGIATLACAAEGAHVTHVDASRPAIGWARENQDLSGLSEKPVRWILDDAIKFCEREVRRGSSYDGILMDPPIYGHGPTGEKWDFFEGFPSLLETCVRLLSEDALFLLVNAYAISASSLMLQNLLKDNLSTRGGKIDFGELALKEQSSRLLSTGIFARWSHE
jgi:23S rRNA (cytosine1962-C5)-methyltransferase